MKNKYEIRGNEVAIFIKSPKYGDVVTIVSIEKFNKLKNYPKLWGVKNHKGTKIYIGTSETRANGKKYIEYLHRFITDAPKGKEVDHINHDTLNNLDSNLRIATPSENQQNRKGASIHSKSGIRGVIWNKAAGKWSTQLRLNGKKVSFGYFHDITLAEKAIIEGRRTHMPFAN